MGSNMMRVQPRRDLLRYTLWAMVTLHIFRGVPRWANSRWSTWLGLLAGSTGLHRLLVPGAPRNPSPKLGRRWVRGIRVENSTREYATL